MRPLVRKYYLRQIVACVLMACLFFNTTAIFATPTNPDVVAGQAGVTQAGNTTTVNMLSNRAVINWDSLNTSSSQVLQYLKATGNFAVLNRVIKGGATQFNGSLFGNRGHIIIINPAGIVFGPTAFVQARQFTASTLDMSNQNFMNGVYEFVTAANRGMVANYGEISAQRVALIAQKVLNAGVIRAPGGYVLMAAGDRVLIGEEGSDIVVEVDSVTLGDEPMEGLGDVINEGTIEAAGGKVILAASSLDGPFINLICHALTWQASVLF